MSVVSRHSARIAMAFCAVSVLGSAILAAAQPARKRAAAGRRQDKQQKPGPFTYGNITISDYESMKGTIGVFAEARGSSVSVDVADPKQPKAKTRLHASVLKATWVKGGGNEVDRLEATGNVRYYSLRPGTKGDTQVFEGTASRATYVKSQNTLSLDGPITYSGTRTDKDGKLIQTVKGTASSAEYDDDKQVVSLKGDVNATFSVPGTQEPTILTGASSITADLSQQPIAYDVRGGTIRLVPNEPKKPVAQPEKKNP